MSEREIREILRQVCERLARQVAMPVGKVAVPVALGALATQPGCIDDGGPLPEYMAPDAIVDRDAVADRGPDGFVPPDVLYMGPDAAADEGPQPPYMAPDVPADPGPQPEYMAPDVPPADATVDPGFQPLYMAADAGPVDPGDMPLYMAPDAGPQDPGFQPLYAAPDAADPDPGVMPPYMAPDPGPQPLYMAADVPPAKDVAREVDEGPVILYGVP